MPKDKDESVSNVGTIKSIKPEGRRDQANASAAGMGWSRRESEMSSPVGNSWTIPNPVTTTIAAMSMAAGFFIPTISRSPTSRIASINKRPRENRKISGEPLSS